MKLILLTGLVSVEKRDLALELGRHYLANGEQVTLIDNIARMSIDPEFTGGETLIRFSGDITHYLADTLAQTHTDVLLVAVSETMNPEELVAALENLHGQLPAVDMQTLALIDLRTCDCFPNVREVLEQNADVVVMMPYDLAGVLEALA